MDEDEEIPGRVLFVLLMDVYHRPTSHQHERTNEGVRCLLCAGTEPPVFQCLFNKSQATAANGPERYQCPGPMKFLPLSGIKATQAYPFRNVSLLLLLLLPLVRVHYGLCSVYDLLDCVSALLNCGTVRLKWWCDVH